MKGKAIIPLALGLVIGLIAVKFGVDAIRSAQGSGQDAVQITAVRAKMDIEAHSEITPDLVEVFTTTDPQFAPPLERIETPEDAVGRVTAKSIPARTPILTTMLAPKGTRPGLVGRIPLGFRAVAVRIDEGSSVGFQITPGDWVDVTVVMDVATSSRSRKETIAEVILQHVQVAAVGHGSQSDAAPQSPHQRPAKSATLLVPEDEVPKLHLAATRGKLTLSLRGEGDEINEDPPKAVGSELTTRFQEPKPEPQPTPTQVTNMTPVPIEQPHQVTVVRGFGGKSVERMMFAGEKSNELLEVSNGMPTRASSSMRRATAPAGRRVKQSDFGNPESDADTSGTPEQRAVTNPDDAIGDE